MVSFARCHKNEGSFFGFEGMKSMFNVFIVLTPFHLMKQSNNSKKLSCFNNYFGKREEVLKKEKRVISEANDSNES